MNDFQKQLRDQLILAPMAGFSDAPFRSVCLEEGADYTCTEMISAKALCFRDRKTAVLARIQKSESPISIQIFGSDPEMMARAAQMLSTGTYEGCLSECLPAAIDINMGCPVHKIVSNGEGSALLRDEVRVRAIVEAVKASSAVPVTVKMRTGFDEAHKNAERIARIVGEAGADAICVHGRTRERMYSPGVDYESIRRVKESVGVPVVGNGDIFTPEDAVKMKSLTGCDALMIARGALGNPFLFAQIKEYLSTGSYRAPSLKTRVNTAKRHLSRMVAAYGEERGVREARKQVGWYVKGFPGAARLRDEVNRAEYEEEILRLLDSLMERGTNER